MLAFIAQNLAPIMFVALFAFLLLGYPVAFSLGAVGLIFFVIGVWLTPYSGGVINLDWPLLKSMPERVFGVLSGETGTTLLAIPFFTFMGLVLEKSGMAEDLLDTIGQVFGKIRGGLAYAVIFVGALLAATTGVVAASVIAMGLISLPIMLRYGYDRRVASGVIAASGTLAQIIPPSLVLIVLADQLGRSVGDMYEAALLPGLMLAGTYALYVFAVSVMNPSAVPGLPDGAIRYRKPDGSRGIVSLAVLTLISGVAGWLAVRGLATKPSETVVLTLAAAIIFALAVAAGNWWRGTAGAGAAVSGLLVAAGLWTALKTASIVTFSDPHMAILINGFLKLLLAVGAGAIVTVALGWPTGLASRLTKPILSPLAERVVFALVPPLFLIFLVLGTIFIGVATPTEGGAMGAIGALALAFIKRRLDRDPRYFNLALIQTAAEATTKLTAFVLFILIGARIFSLTFYGIEGHKWVEHLLTSLPGGQTGFLIFINILVFLLAFFLDFFELAFIVVPLLVPAAKALDVDLVWLGILLAVNMQTSFLHPPFGFALFYLRSVAPKAAYTDKVTGRTMAPVKTSDIYWGAVPFVVIQCAMVALLIAWPSLVIKPKTLPQIKPAGPVSAPAAPGSEAPLGKGLSLPPYPPAIEGAPPPITTGPGAPVLDLSVPPKVEAGR